MTIDYAANSQQDFAAGRRQGCFHVTRKEMYYAIPKVMLRSDRGSNVDW